MSYEKIIEPVDLFPSEFAGMQYTFKFVHHEAISLGDRQRQVHDPDALKSLASSIAKHGLLNPLVIKEDGEGFLLVAGGRRLTAIRSLGSARGALGYFRPWPYIPCHFVDQVPDHALKELELEENLKRENLFWQDEAVAFVDYYTLRQQENAAFTITELGEALGVSQARASKAVLVGKALLEADERVLACASINSAYNVIGRQVQREIDAELENFTVGADGGVSLNDLGMGDDKEGRIETKPIAELDHLDLTSRPVSPTLLPARSAAENIINADFITWIKNYDGPKFNFIHCDFPYGINFDSSAQAAPKRIGLYDDSPETYWHLLSAFLEFKDAFIAKKAHVLFWFSMNNYELTKQFFTDEDFMVNPMPLIWSKSNKHGIIPDSTRGPRQVYETAFLISRGDRKIVKPVSNVADFPVNRKTAKHPSEKPTEMLEHFFTMFVDKTTEMLDPTCGAGSALVAAERFGANHILGLEYNEEFANVARTRLNNHRLGGNPHSSQTLADDLGPTDEELNDIELDASTEGLFDDLTIDDLGDEL